MARPGITQEQVNHAADSLVAAGKNATIDAVRDVLGTGSKGTIHKMLGAWKAATPAVAKVAREIPLSLSAALASEIDKASANARAEVEKDLVLLQENADRLAADLETIEAERDILADQVAALTQERDTLAGKTGEQGKEIARLQADFERERGAVEAARVEVAKGQILNESQAGLIDALKGELAVMKDSLKSSEKARQQAEQSAAVLTAKLDASDATKADLARLVEAMKADHAKAIEKAEARADKAEDTARKASEESAELRGELVAVKATLQAECGAQQENRKPKSSTHRV